MDTASAAMMVGEWFAGYIIDKLVNFVESHVSDHWDLLTDVEEKLKEIQDRLPRIQAVIHAAEGRPIRDPALVDWLRQLKEAAYEADVDLLDEIEYRQLEDQEKKCHRRSVVQLNQAMATEKRGSSTCCFSKLTEECVRYLFSFTSPRDVCRLSLVCKSFLAAAQIDRLWESFLPRDFAEILSRATDPVDYSSRKELYFRLCQPLLVDDGKLEKLPIGKINREEDLHDIS